LSGDEAGANPLSDLSRFSGGHRGASDLVQKRGLPMVHVSKNDGDG
jgi:hypothetical protein